MDSEAKLVRRLAWQLRRAGYIVTAEVPVGMRSVDLFCVDRFTGTTLAIEAKLHDWRRALRQAETYKFVADLVYLALPTQVVTQSCLSSCQELGIGVLAVPPSGTFTRVQEGQVHENKRTAFSRRALMAVGRKASYAALYA